MNLSEELCSQLNYEVLVNLCSTILLTYLLGHFIHAPVRRSSTVIEEERLLPVVVVCLHQVPGAVTSSKIPHINRLFTSPRYNTRLTQENNNHHTQHLIRDTQGQRSSRAGNSPQRKWLGSSHDNDLKEGVSLLTLRAFPSNRANAQCTCEQASQMGELTMAETTETFLSWPRFESLTPRLEVQLTNHSTIYAHFCQTFI